MWDDETGDETNDAPEHEDNDFQAKYGERYETQDEPDENFLFYAFSQNVPLNNEEILEMAGRVADHIKEEGRARGTLNGIETTVLRLEAALRATENAYQERGEDYEEVATRFTEALRGQEVEGQTEAVIFLRSLAEKIKAHPCQCNHCKHNASLAATALEWLRRADNVTGGTAWQRYDESDKVVRRGDGSDMRHKRKGSMFIRK